MASLEFKDDALKAFVKEIVGAAIQAVDFDSLVQRAAKEVLKDIHTPKKPVYSAREVARILGITVAALQQRRIRGQIKGEMDPNGKSYLFKKSEVERVIGHSL